jgi:nitrogen regulatory protein PII
MAQLVVFVLDDVRHFPDVLRAWQGAGVRGITILESTGLARQQQVFERDDIPLMPSLRDMLAGRERHHRTLLAVVEDDSVIDEVIRITQEIVGDLTEPDTGIMFITPLSRVVGIPKRLSGE